MNRFPMSIDLTGKTVFLIGSGPQIRAKAEKLAPFGAVLRRQSAFTQADASLAPALVIVGDTAPAEAAQISALCQHHHIPVNVVDIPHLCSFFFPALITRGCLTISVSTDGSMPAAAAYLRRQLQQALPEDTGSILDWLCSQREALQSRGLLKPAIAMAFSLGRPLTDPELEALSPEA